MNRFRFLRLFNKSNYIHNTHPFKYNIYSLHQNLSINRSFHTSNRLYKKKRSL